MAPERSDVPQEPSWFLKVTTYKNGKHEIKTTSEARLSELDLSKYDAVIDLVHRKAEIRPENGKVIKYLGQLPSMGPRRGLAALLAIMRRPGRFSLPYELAALGKCDNLAVDNNLSAAILAIRRFLGETGKKPWFILTITPLAAAWSPDRSFCLVEREDRSS